MSDANQPTNDHSHQGDSAVDSDLIETALQHMSQAKLSRQDVQAILTQYAKHIGVEALALNKEGTVQITIDNETELSLVHLPHFPGLIVASPMPKKASQHRAILCELLQANMSWEMTHGGSFAMLPPGNDLMLCRLVSLATGDIELLDRELAAFVGLAQHWHKKITADLESIADTHMPRYTRSVGTKKSTYKIPTKLDIQPLSASILQGKTQPFIAIATYSDHSTQEVTNQVSWSSSSQKIVSIDSNGTAKGIAKGAAKINATFENQHAFSKVLVVNDTVN